MVNPPPPPPPPPILRGPNNYASWKADMSARVFATIASSLDPTQHAHIAHCAENGKAAWAAIERLYEPPSRVALRRKLYRHSEQHPDESIDAYARRKMEIVERLRELGTTVTDDEIADSILMDVNDKFVGTAEVIAGTRSYGLDDMLAKLRMREAGLMNSAAPTSAASNSARKLPPILAPAPPPPSMNNNIDSAADPNPTAKTTPRSRGSGKRTLAAAPVTADDIPAVAASDSTPPPPNGDVPSSPTKRKSEGSPDSTSTPTTKKPRISASASRSARKPKLPPPSSPRSATPQRPFRCLFTFAGCTQSFASKNEWKRHINHIHLQLWYWRCDFPACANRKAFFNRKDLFGQHLKRMHSEQGGEACAEIQERCKKERRKPPEGSKCGFCKKVFEGVGSWEALVDHVGDHYAQGARWEDWSRDGGFEEWALKEGVVRKSKDGQYSQDERQYPAENQQP